MGDLHNFFVITGSTVSADVVKDAMAMTNRLASGGFMGLFLKSEKKPEFVHSKHLAWHCQQATAGAVFDVWMYLCFPALKTQTKET